MFGHEAALFTPDRARWPTCSRSRRWSRPARRCSASPRPTSPAPSSARTARSPASRCAPGPHPRGQVDLAAIEAMYAPDMGPFFVRTAAVSVENTHNFAGGAVLPLEDLRGAARVGRHGRRRGSTSTAPGSGTPTSRPAPRWPTTAGRRRAGRVPVQGARRPDRLADGRLGRRDRRGARPAQADGRRDAPGRRAGGRRGVRPRPPRRAAGRRPRARPAARRGARPRPGDAWTPTSSSSTRPDAAGVRGRGRARRACGSLRSGPRAVRLVTHLDVTRADAERAAAVLARLG